MTNSPLAASTRGLTRTYGRGDTAVHALRGIDLDLPAGRFTAIMGRAGSGKSTLMHCLAGLDSPTTGSVAVGGRALDSMDDTALTLCVFLNGSEIPTQSAQGAPVIDDTFLILLNAWEGPIPFTLPSVSFGRRWAHELSTAAPELEAGAEVHPARGVVPVDGRSLVVLRRVA